MDRVVAGARRFQCVFLLMISIAMVLPVAAATVRHSEQARSEVADVDAVQSQAALTAQRWGLTEAEWRQYEAVMSGPRGLWSPGLDPLTALGVEAKDDAQRRHLAELWVRLEYERVGRELAFERAKQEAMARLYPQIKPVAYRTSSSGNARALPVVGGVHWLLFIDAGCDRACRRTLQRWLRRQADSADAALDVYVRGLVDDAALRGWALQHKLPADRLREGRVTLNHEAGLLARLALTERPLPLVLTRAAGGELTPVAE